MAWEIVTFDVYKDLKLTDAGPQYYIGMADNNNNIIGGLTSYNAQDFELIVDDNDISVGTSESDFNTTFPWISNLGFELASKTNDSMQMTPWGIAPNSYNEYTLDFKIYLKNKKTNQISDVAIHIHLTDLDAGGTQKVIIRWFYIDLSGGTVQYLTNWFLFFITTDSGITIDYNKKYCITPNTNLSYDESSLLCDINTYFNTNIIDTPFMWSELSNPGELINGAISSYALRQNFSRVHIGLCWKSNTNDTTSNPECYYITDYNAMLGTLIKPNGTGSPLTITELDFIMPNAITKYQTYSSFTDSLLYYHSSGLKKLTFNNTKNKLLQCCIGTVENGLYIKFVSNATASVNIGNASEDSLNPTNLVRYS